MAATMEFELRLDEYCSDLSDMRKELQVYRAVALYEADQGIYGESLLTTPSYLHGAC